VLLFRIIYHFSWYVYGTLRLILSSNGTFMAHDFHSVPRQPHVDQLA